MQKCIIGKKIGMTQLFDENGKFIPGHRRRSRSLCRRPEKDNRKRRLRSRADRFWRGHEANM